MASKPGVSSGGAYRCPRCGSMVFTLVKFHDVVCGEYRKHPALVAGAEAYYQKKLAEDLAEEERKKFEVKEKPKRKGRKVEKDTGL